MVLRGLDIGRSHSLNCNVLRLQMQSPALEFSKMLCHLVSLDPQLTPQLARLRRNLLKMLGVREFASEALFINPGLSFVMPDVVCEFCGHCRDLDVCREGEWLCECCQTPYDHELMEYRLVQTVRRQSRSFLAQDLQCTKCKLVQRRALIGECERCTGPFELRSSQQALTFWLKTFSSIATHHSMPWLVEVLEFLVVDSLG